jgi:hypothetical protein
MVSTMGINRKVLAFGATGILALGITGAAVGGHISNSTANKAYASGGTTALAQTAASGQTSLQAAVTKATGQSGTKATTTKATSTKASSAAQSSGAATVSPGATIKAGGGGGGG